LINSRHDLLRFRNAEDASVEDNPTGLLVNPVRRPLIEQACGDLRSARRS
jgi:hypothetical protein